MFIGVPALQMGPIHVFAAMTGAGVFERYPRLTVSFGESGIGWVPYALDRMAFELNHIEQQLQGLAADQVHKITCENAAKFYNLTN